MAALRLVEKGRLSCGRNARQRQRFGLNISGIRSPDHMIWMFSAVCAIDSFRVLTSNFDAE